MSIDTRALRGAFDLIYRNPPALGKEAWLFGTGAAGATLWNPPNGLRLQLGHTGLLDGGSGSEAEREGIGVCLRHAATLALELVDCPLFDPHYLHEYQGRLTLEDGVLRVSGSSVYGRFELTAYYCEDPSAFVLEYSDECDRPVERRLRFERRGSRTLDTGTRESADPTQGFVVPAVAALGDSRYGIVYAGGGACAATVLAVDTSGNAERASDAVAQSTATDELGVTVAFAATPAISLRLVCSLSVVGYGELGKPLQLWTPTAPEAAESAAEEAANRLATAFSRPREALLADHHARKAGQWDDTFIHLPDDEHFAQLYWLARYHLKASYRGDVPPFFINGPWGWMQDVRMWPGCWFHWNIHGASCSLAHIGEAEGLLQSYAAWRMRQLPTARENALNDFDCRGAVFQDQQLPHGATNTWTGQRHTHFLATGAQAALHLYDAWRFTGDREFLERVVHPYMAGVVEFWRCYLEPDADGILHSPASIPYEYHGDDSFRDCLTDLAHLRALFPAFALAAAEAGAEDELSAWALEATPRLAPFVPAELPLQYVTTIQEDGSRIYNNPFFYGDIAKPGDQVLAIGKRSGDERWVDHVSTHFDGRSRYGAFCSSQTAHVYPAALVTSDASPDWAERTGADEEARRQWERAVNALRTIRRYPQDESSFDKAGVADPTIAWTGHSLELPAFARLGLSEPLSRAMRYYVDRYQLYKQGMWNYHPRKRWYLDAAHPRFPDGSAGRIEYNPWLLHFAMEPQGIFAETLAIMLCDSAGEVIRLFQAYDGDAVFRLPARGGFIVTAGQEGGALRCVEIESLRGETCAVRVPWDEVALEPLHAADDEAAAPPLELGSAAPSECRQRLVPEGAVVRFDTKPGGRYRLCPAGTDCEIGQVSPPPESTRELASSVLGIPRRF